MLSNGARTLSSLILPVRKSEGIGWVVLLIMEIFQLLVLEISNELRVATAAVQGGVDLVEVLDVE